MGRFIRNFGFLTFALLLPFGLYLLQVGTENHGSDASFSLLGGAVLVASGLVSVSSAIREHFILRDHLRYARGRRRPRASGST
jgi:hypothetical protein